MDLSEKKEKIEAIAKQAAACQRCDLYRDATHAVPGDGNPGTKTMFIGEAPGYYEDKIGLPFVGQAGKLLEALLQLIELPREKIFIGNMIKHRPPENRDPLPEEIQACRIWLNKQIEIIEPKIIVTLGRFSMAKFLPEGKISQIHGNLYSVDWSLGKTKRKFKVVPMYHPAAGLRSTKVFEDLKTDFKKLKKVIEMEIKS